MYLHACCTKPAHSKSHPLRSWCNHARLWRQACPNMHACLPCAVYEVPTPPSVGDMYNSSSNSLTTIPMDNITVIKHFPYWEWSNSIFYLLQGGYTIMNHHDRAIIGPKVDASFVFIWLTFLRKIHMYAIAKTAWAHTLIHEMLRSASWGMEDPALNILSISLMLNHKLFMAKLGGVINCWYCWTSVSWL